MHSFLRFGLLAVMMTVLFAPIGVFAQALPGAQPSNGTCRFDCVSATNPTGPTIAAQVILRCTTLPADTTCQDACTRVCPIAGTGQGQNGLPVAQGTGLRCASSPVPRCVVPQAAGTTAAGGAATGGQTSNAANELPNPLGTTDLLRLFGRVVQAVMGILGSLALLWFIWGGVLWMTAEGSKRTDDAKAVIKNAALGIVILFFSYGIATAFLGIFEATARRSAPAVGGSAGNNATTR